MVDAKQVDDNMPKHMDWKKKRKSIEESSVHMYVLQQVYVHNVKTFTVFSGLDVARATGQ